MTFGALAELSGGRSMRMLVEFSQVASNLGTAVLFLLLSGQNIQSLF